MCGLIKKFIQKYNNGISIRNIISVSFTFITFIVMILLGMVLFNRFERTATGLIIENNSQLVEQASLNMDSYIKKMLQISNTMCFTTIKNTDLSEDSLDESMNLLYESNKDNIVSIACFNEDGSLVNAAPITTLKQSARVGKQEWFVNAYDTAENAHFSPPHVQNIFENSSDRYYWVVSLSRAVELTYDGNPTRGIVLVDMNFSGIEQLFTKINNEGQGYMYLIDNNGEIIYHPKQKLIYSNIYEENNIQAANYEAGSHRESFDGEDRVVIVKTMGYTGWKIVSVTPVAEFTSNLRQTRLFVAIIVAVAIFLIMFANLFVSKKIADPIMRLERSVKDLENGNLNLDIYIGGSKETQHLGRTIKSVVAQLRQLMEDIVTE